MLLDLDRYLNEMDELLISAGAEVDVYAEVGDYPLKGYSLKREKMPHVYLSAGMHGDEPAAALALLRLIENGVLERKLSFSICPCLNPSGLALGTRENASEFGGIDMNRDYLQQQTKEVQGHIAWLERLNPDYPALFISLHEDWETRGYYFYEINCGEDCPERYAFIVNRLKGTMDMEDGGLIDGHKIRRKGWIYHESEPDLEEGWPEAIYVAKNGCPLSFTFESPSSVAMEERIGAHVLAVKAVLDYEYPA